MDWASIGAVIGAVGGLEGVKWLFTRKASRRMADEEADRSELKTLMEVNEFLQQQLKDKEMRFADQTATLRSLQSQVFKAAEERHAAELELATKRCDDIPCPWRKPPTAYTAPPKGTTIDEYQAAKDGPQL